MATAVDSSTSFSPGPMGCSDMVRAILDYIQGGDDAELRDVALREMNMAVDDLNVRNWQKITTTQTITLVAPDDEYELASDFKDTLQARLVRSSSRKNRLIYEPYRRFMERFKDRDSHTSPQFYTIDYSRRMLVLEGPPSSDFVATYDSIDLDYYKRMAYLTCGSSTHGGPPEFNSFLIWRGRAGVAAVRGERAAADRAEAKSAMIFRELRISDGDLQTDWE